MDQMHAYDALVGAWRLVSWENRAADAQVTHPMGMRNGGASGRVVQGVGVSADAFKVTPGGAGRVGAPG